MNITYGSLSLEPYSCQGIIQDFELGRGQTIIVWVWLLLMSIVGIAEFQVVFLSTLYFLYSPKYFRVSLTSLNL